MSDPIDIKALDEYLKGGSDISQRYRELGREDVPPELDRRVLDEARAAVASGGGARSRSWLRWSAPVALAASVVLVVAVVIESGVQDDTSFASKAVDEVRQVPDQRQAEEHKLLEKSAQSLEQESPTQFAPEPAAIVTRAAPAAAPASPPAAGLAKAEAERSKSGAPEQVRVDAQAMRDRAQDSVSVPVELSARDSRDAQFAAEQPVPSLAGSAATVAARKEVGRAAPATEADSADDSVSEIVTGNRVRRAAPGRTAGPRNTISGSALSTETRPAADTDAEQSDPDQWLEEIRNLRRAGKSVEADREWQEFRKSFPDFRVADDDIARQKP